MMPLFLFSACSDSSYPCPKSPGAVIPGAVGVAKLRRVSVPTDKNGLVKKRAYRHGGMP